MKDDKMSMGIVWINPSCIFKRPYLVIIEIHFEFTMEPSEEIAEETAEKAPEVDLKVLEAIKAKELAEDWFPTVNFRF